jgi:uncharacterized protein YkwD
MKFGSNTTDYYSHYDVNTFFCIENLHQRITKSYMDLDLLNAAVFWLTNMERKRFNLNQFEFHTKLKQTAIWHSELMKIYNFFDHDNPFNARYRTIGDRIDSVNDSNFQGFMSWGENIADYPVFKANEYFTVDYRNGVARLFSTTSGREILPYTHYEFARKVVEGWMNSSGHRRNILCPDFQYLGCGCAKYERQGNRYSMVYFKLTQNFGGELVSNNLLYSIGNKIGKFLRK